MIHTAYRGRPTSPKYAATPLSTRVLMGVVSASISSTILGGILLPFQEHRGDAVAHRTAEPIVASVGGFAACAVIRPR